MQKLDDIGIEQCTLSILRKKEKPQDWPGGKTHNTFTMMRSITARTCCFAATFGKHG
jgi:hypothetical protein